jgi:predicted nucleic acid-binding protein
MIVLDANILIRAILGKRVGSLLASYAARGVRFYAPAIAFADAAEYLPNLLQKRGQSEIDAAGALLHLQSIVESVDNVSYDLFEVEAKERLGGRDEEDWPIVATALALSCGIWTEDKDFFGSGIAVWTTNRVEIFLRSQVERAAPGEM